MCCILSFNLLSMSFAHFKQYFFFSYISSFLLSFFFVVDVVVVVVNVVVVVVAILFIFCCFYLFCSVHFVYSSSTDIHLLVFGASTVFVSFASFRSERYSPRRVERSLRLKLYSTQFSLTLQFCHPFRRYRFLCFRFRCRKNNFFPNSFGILRDKRHYKNNIKKQRVSCCIYLAVKCLCAIRRRKNSKKIGQNF